MAEAPGQNAMIVGARVTFVSGNDNTNTYELTTNEEGLVELPVDEDPLARPVGVQAIRFTPTIRLKWEGAASEELRVRKTFEVRFTDLKITRLRDNVVRIPFARFVVTPRVKGVPVRAKVYIGTPDNQGLVPSEPIDFRGDSVTLYCPDVCSDTHALVCGDKTLSSVGVFGAYKEKGADTYLGSCRYALPLSGERVVDLELMLQDPHFVAWKTQVINVMGNQPGAEAQALNVVDAMFQLYRPDSILREKLRGPMYYGQDIYFPPSFNFTAIDAPENAFHEWSHAIMELCYHVDEPGGGHQLHEPCEAELAWSEGRAHFVSVCLCRAFGLPQGRFSPGEALNLSPILYERREGIGRHIEFVVAAALLTYYERRGVHNPVDVLSDFYLHYQQRNSVAFFNAARAAAPNNEELHEVACQVEMLFRMTPVQRSMFRVRVAEKKGRTPSDPLTLEARLTTAGGRPLIPEFNVPITDQIGEFGTVSSERIRYIWSEKGRELATGKVLNYRPAGNGNHEVALAVLLQMPACQFVPIAEATHVVQGAALQGDHTTDWWLFKPANWSFSQEFQLSVKGPPFKIVREVMDGSTRNVTIEIPSQAAGQELKYKFTLNMRNRRMDGVPASAQLHQLWVWEITDAKGRRTERRPNPECTIAGGDRTEVSLRIMRPVQMVDGKTIPQPQSTVPLPLPLKITFVPAK